MTHDRFSIVLDMPVIHWFSNTSVGGHADRFAPFISVNQYMYYWLGDSWDLKLCLSRITTVHLIRSVLPLSSDI